MLEDEYGMSWVGASFARAQQLAEEEYKLWLPKPESEEDDNA